MTLADLPAINATLNAASAALLVSAYIAIRRRRVRRHVTLVVAAIITSTVFLACYLYYHAHVGGKHFPLGGQPLRAIYFAILLSHTILATAVVPMIAWTVTRALRRDWARHRAIARPTLWVWLYVSVTGVIVYLMLYQLPKWV